MTATQVAGSFRDPGGFVFTVDGVIHRQVNERARDDYDLLHSSGLYDALVERHLLVSHEEVDVPAPRPGAHRVIRPQQIPFVSYPYEWCFGQLKDAALATLAIQELALDHGMTLRDASAYNIQLLDGRPVLIDTLSFGPRRDGEPWVAYRQFCQHFLAPLALMALVDVRLGQLSRVHLDGIPLDLASTLLPGATKLRPGLGVHIHAHARSQQRHAGAAGSGGAASSGKAVSERALRGLVDNLRATVTRLEWSPPASEWRDYYAGDSYSDDAFARKGELVGAMVERVAPRTVWDLGANTGYFSRIAAAAGAHTVAFDIDPSAVQLNYDEVKKDGDTRVVPLVLDLTNPSPAIGWANAERATVAERGPVDLVLALALIHHLAISNNVPLERIAAFFGELAPALVIEFVPKTDAKVRTLLASREDIFDDYTQDSFEAAFGTVFDVEERRAVPGSERTLYLLRRR